MSSASKTFALILTLTIAVSSLSLIIIKPSYAQTTTTTPSPTPFPTPSVPEFTLQLAGPPYTVPTTYSLNQSTGQIVAQIGYTNEYSNIVLTVKNQPYASYYNVQIKTNQIDNWMDLYTVEGGGTYPGQSTDSNYTNISISIEEVGLAGTQTDIQVQAMYGYIYNANPYSIYANYTFYGTTSAWSPTQTVTIPANVPLSPTPAPSSSTSPLTPTETPTSTAESSSPPTSFWQITSTIVIAILLAVIIALLLLMRKRNRLTEVKH